MKTLPALAMGLMLVALWPHLAAAESPRLALLVGISKYKPGPDAWRELHTEKDIAEMKEVLMRHHGFQEASIRILQNEQATGEGIRRAFREHLIEKATPGAVVVFHFSGHGQQIIDDNADELDGLDESLVPYDTASQRAPVAAQTNLRDDEIGRWLQALRQKMTAGGKLRGSINVFLDSCYSGTATRGSLVERGRSWSVELDGPLPKVVASGRHKGAAGLLPLDEVTAGGFVVLSAARSHQTAKEVDGRGAFTQALVHALAKAGPGATVRTVFDRAADEVAGLALFQDPVFEGPIDTVLFSGTVVAQPPYLTVAADPMQPGLVRLPVGEVHGTTVGSVYAIHRAGSALLTARDRLGEAVVESVEPFVSWLRLRQQVGQSQLVAARAVEVEHAQTGRKVRVQFLRLESLPALSVELLKLPFIEAVTGTNYQIQIAYDAPTKRLLVRRASTAQPIAELSVEQDPRPPLEQRLRGEWRWQNLSALISNNDSLRVEVQLVPVQAVKEVEGPWKGQVVQPPVPRRDVSAGRQVCLRNGDFFQLRFNNPSLDYRFVTLIELNPSGEIDVLFPDSQMPDDSRIAPGILQPGHGPYIFEVTNPPGTTRYVAIVTRQPVDFRSLIFQAGLASQAGRLAWATSTARGAQAKALGPLSPLAELLMDAAAAQPPDRAERVVVPPNSWGTAEAWLEVPAALQPCPRN